MASSPHLALTLLVAFVATIHISSGDWSDCVAPCHCKWISGKKTALCKSAGFHSIPSNFSPDIQVLDMSSNRIDELGHQIFHQAGLVNLQRIFLSHSGINIIQPDAFDSLIILVELDLSHNHITTLHPNTFRDTERLRILILNNNPIRRLDSFQFPPLPHLKMLHLDECELAFIHSEALQQLIALETLSLRSNRLQSLSHHTFQPIVHLKTLHLEGNPWQCDCNLRLFRDWLLAHRQQSLSTLLCLTPLRLQGLTWDTIPSNHFACPPQIRLWPSEHIQSEAGGNVTIACYVTGDPPPRVQWLHDGAVLNETVSGYRNWLNVTVLSVTDRDTGIYTCEAENIVALLTANITLLLPKVVTAPTLNKTPPHMLAYLIQPTVLIPVFLISTLIVCFVAILLGVRRFRTSNNSHFKASVSFSSQQKTLLGSLDEASYCENSKMSEGSESHRHHIMGGSGGGGSTSEDTTPTSIYPPPPLEFSGSISYAGIESPHFIVMPPCESLVDLTRCPDLLDLPYRIKCTDVTATAMTAVASASATTTTKATIPRRQFRPPKYDNMGPRVTAAGSCSTLSLSGIAAGNPCELDTTEEGQPPTPAAASPQPQTAPSFVNVLQQFTAIQPAQFTSL